MNLLPYSFRKKLVTEKILRRWIAVWTVCLLVGVGVTLVSWAGQASAATEQADLEARARPFQKLEAENEKLATEIAAIQKRESILEDVNGISDPLSYLTLISRSAAAAEGELFVNRVAISEAEEIIEKAVQRRGPKGRSVTPAKTKDIIQVNLSGLATNHASVATFVTTLRESGVFRSVELKSSTALPLPHGNGRQFDVICKR